MNKKKTLIDSIYINNSGGMVLLNFFINTILEKQLSNRFYFLLDPRGHYSYLDKINFEIGDSSEMFRYKFYKHNKNKFSKIFCFGNVPPPYKMTLPVYTYFHRPILDNTLTQSWKKKLKKRYIKFIGTNTKEFIVQTEVIKKQIEANFSNKIFVRKLPFFDLSKDLVRINVDEISFVYISNANDHKNHDILLDAWQKLYDQGYNVKLNLTITKSYTRILERIESMIKNGIDIQNHGYTDVNKLFSLCTHQIYPSLSESFGLGLVESVNAGVDVIASDLPYVYEVIEPSLVFDPKDMDSIVLVVTKVLLKQECKSSKIVVKNKLNELIDLILSD